MTTRPRPALAATPLLALILILVGSTSAASAGSSQRLEFELHAGNGYRVIVQAEGATAILSVTRAKHDAKTGSLSSYIARRKGGDGAIRATFGNLGSIAMRFRPKGAATRSTSRNGCAAGPTTRHGLFVGSLRFRGEDGYVAVSAGRAKGESVTPAAPSCGAAGASAGSGGAGESRAAIFQFEAGFRSGVLAEVFYASRKGGRPARFVASVEETEGTLAIHRLAIGRGGPGTFATDDALSFATIAPPAPFEGSGLLARDPFGARLWNGSLAVSFPGAHHVPLTGPLFKTTLTRSL